MTVTVDQTLAALRERERLRTRHAEQRAAELRAALVALLPWMVDRWGVGEVWLFGSLVTGDVHAESDVDLAVDRVTRGHGFALGAELSRRLGAAVDLVELDRARPALVEAIRTHGERVR